MFTHRPSSIFLLIAVAATAPLAASAAGTDFSYDPDSPTGPSKWGELSIPGNQCDTKDGANKKNSPIAIQSRNCDRFASYGYSHGTCRMDDLTFELTGSGVKASYPASDDVCQRPVVDIPGVPGEYKALQLHIHTGSEHTIDGGSFSAELHAVHAEIGGDRLAVIGTMIVPDADSDNALFEQLLQGWSAVFDASESTCAAKAGGNRARRNNRVRGRGLSSGSSGSSATSDSADDGVFSPYMLLDDDVAGFYQYDGGLTTPPCSEVVWWNVADAPMSVTQSQYERLERYVTDFVDPNTCDPGTFAGPDGITSRPVQPLGDRTVERVCQLD